MKNKVAKFRVGNRIANTSYLIDCLITHPKGLIFFLLDRRKSAYSEAYVNFSQRSQKEKEYQ
jgi:hypothetical protein